MSKRSELDLCVSELRSTAQSLNSVADSLTALFSGSQPETSVLPESKPTSKPLTLERHRLGLFLPVSHRQIFSSYILLGSLVYIVLTIFVGLLMGSKSYLTLIFFTLYSIVFAFDVFIEIRGRKFKQPIQTVLRIFSLMLGFLFVA